VLLCFISLSYLYLLAGIKPIWTEFGFLKVLMKLLLVLFNLFECCLVLVSDLIDLVALVIAETLYCEVLIAFQTEELQSDDSR
jgi:hypothetical protein